MKLGLQKLIRTITQPKLVYVYVDTNKTYYEIFEYNFQLLFSV